MYITGVFIIIIQSNCIRIDCSRKRELAPAELTWKLVVLTDSGITARRMKSSGLWAIIQDIKETTCSWRLNY